jgi:hypothetical protein
MKHAGPEALAALGPLLVELRARVLLKEKSSGVFYLKSRAFLHFHEDPKGYFADVRLEEDFDRFPATTERQRATLLRRVDRKLASL